MNNCIKLTKVYLKKKTRRSLMYALKIDISGKDEHMKIAICDDEKIHRDKLVSLIQPYSVHYSDMDIEQFECGEELVSLYKSGTRFDIIILDIQLKDIDGVQTAQEIRKTDKNAIIIFVTSFTKYISAAFRLNAFQFLVKPITKDSFTLELERAILQYYTNHSKYYIEGQTKTTVFNISDIVYIEGYHRQIAIYTENAKYTVYAKLDNEEKKLAPMDFVRTHQGFLVNMAYFKTIERDTVVCNNGSVVPLSARKRAEVKKRFNQYLTGYTL